ncbi:MAG: potassium transporter TrkH [Lachnospiraceae bacterium]|nr:potassium transporter TrkH [Lachnospiraceae bacterium]
MLPVCSAAGTYTDPLTALFTATTSVCVTGLVVVDTFSYYSTVGHAVILFLIQIGGLGIITVASILMVVMRRRFTMGDRLMLKDALNLNTPRGVLTMLKSIFKGTFLVEGLGAALYCIEFIPRFGVGRGIWVSVFNSSSAFCNAGIDILGSDSLASYYDNPLVLCVTMALIVLGGLGFVVWFDIMGTVRNNVKKRYRLSLLWKRLSEHTKLVLVLTFSLIVVGAVFIFFNEYNNPATIGGMTLSQKIYNSFFESITLRTAGFSSFPQKGLTDISCVGSYFLMFIGGSPIGTAGGIKTVTFFLACMNVYTYIADDMKNLVFKKYVTPALMRKASVIVSVSTTTMLVMTLLLMATNPVAIEDGIFEIVSATATVGLTRDLTSSLNTVGKIIIIISMYLGRIGPISMAIFFAARKPRKDSLHYTEGEFFVG